MSFSPTAQQRAFIDALLNTKDHLALRARAGTGKTATILLGVEAVAKASPNSEQIVLAYNKAIEIEISKKLKEKGFTDWRKVSASTIHALGLSLVKFAFGLNRDNIDDKKVIKIIDDLSAKLNSYQDNIYAEYGYQIASLVRYAKQAGFGFFSDLPIEDVGPWYALAEHYDVNGLDDTSQMAEVVAAAQYVYKLSLADTKTIDFDDMILFPLIKNLKTKYGKDYIYLDESQDLSRARQALAQKFLKPHTGRIIIVGDDRQAIYGFSGADASALTNLIDRFRAITIPLTITWRCPRSVVALAQKYVPDIQAAPDAPEGIILRTNELTDQLDENCAILCRNTAPLIKTAYSLIRRGIPCKVEGRAIGEGLKKLASRWKVATIDALLTRLEDYKEREMQKAMAKGNESKAQEVEDKVQTLKEICNACLLNKLTRLDDVLSFIDNLFADGETAVTVLATYHRSKGREWDHVFLLEHASRCPSPAARQQWQRDQEDNLAYVAITRAKQTLTFLN